jgi:uncharacterized membrane protein YphA (DoxX/SURF4 family)
MNLMQRVPSMVLLRWSVGLVVLWESCQFAASTASVHHLQRMGLPGWIAPVLGVAEIGAVVVFLVPRLRRIGGYALLVIFAIAAALHILHGQFEIGPLVVYSAAVLVCIPDGAPQES